MRHLDVMWVYWNLIKQTKNIYTSFLFIPVITYKPGSSIQTNTVKRILNPMSSRLSSSLSIADFVDGAMPFMTVL